ncbi:MAG TPA: hypothetical protein VII94_00675 [Candidatus Saccharimonadales bacterium]
MTNKLESRILELYNQGKKNRVIARELSIHHNTVKYWLDKNNLKANYFGQPIEMVDEENARCSKCKDVLHIDNFQFGRKSKNYEYRFSYCNLCRKRQLRLNLNSDINRFLNDHYNRTKLRAQKKSIPFDLTKEQYMEQYNKQKGLCFFTDEKMVCELGSGKHKNSLSIDKIIPDKGYVLGNFVFASNKINTCKNDLTLEEIKRWMPLWYERIEKFLGVT